MPMLTVSQWKDARRVDHEQVVFFGHLFNRRTRPRPAYADLKVFDADVMAFAAAQTSWDKIRPLGDIIADANQFIVNAPQNLPPRYLTAVRTLRDAAADEFSTLTDGTITAATLRSDIESISRGAALAPNSVTVHVYAQGSNLSDATLNGRINGHLGEVNRLFNPGDVQVTRLNAALSRISLADSPVDQGGFNEQGRAPFELIRYIKGKNNGADVSVVYTDKFMADDVQGFTCRQGRVYSSAVPVKPIVVVTLNPPGTSTTYDTTLAHELTHGITGEGGHSNEPDSLMAKGAIRNPTAEVSFAMLAWLRSPRPMIKDEG